MTSEDVAPSLARGGGTRKKKEGGTLYEDISPEHRHPADTFLGGRPKSLISARGASSLHGASRPDAFLPAPNLDSTVALASDPNRGH